VELVHQSQRAFIIVVCVLERLREKGEREETGNGGERRLLMVELRVLTLRGNRLKSKKPIAAAGDAS